MPKRQYPGIEYEWHYERQRAHHKVFRALKDGTLVRPPMCLCCLRPDIVKRNRWDQSVIEAHHADYAKPLEVQWLCALCHKAEHLRMDKEGLVAFNFYHLQDPKDPNSPPI